MKVAKLICLDGEGLPELDGTIREVNGELVADSVGAGRILDSQFHWNGRDYTKVDGEAFLDILPKVVSGSHARIVLEEEPEAASYAKSPDDAFAVQIPEAKPRPLAKKRPGYSSIPRLLLEIDEQKRRDRSADAIFQATRTPPQ